MSCESNVGGLLYMSFECNVVGGCCTCHECNVGGLLYMSCESNVGGLLYLSFECNVVGGLLYMSCESNVEGQGLLYKSCESNMWLYVSKSETENWYHQYVVLIIKVPLKFAFTCFQAFELILAKIEVFTMERGQILVFADFKDQ